MAVPFRFIETIRFEDEKFHLLEYHQERINCTFASHYPDATPLQLEKILPLFSESGKHKFRLTYDFESYELAHSLYQRKSIRSIKLVEANINYNFKFADRSELQKLLDQSNADEIILVKNDLITDSSYSNLAFYDGTDWWTPEEPLLAGVRRAKLLAEQRIKPMNIEVGDIFKFQKVSFINAMLDIKELEISIE